MAEELHPIAIPHLPPFVTAPGETDMLFVVTAVMVLFLIIGIGVFYFKLHALPEQLAHGGQKTQFQIVSVLALLALFTHNHAFWIAGLLLALLPIPDFISPIKSISKSLERMASSVAPPVANPPGTSTTEPQASATVAAQADTSPTSHERPGA